MFIQDILVITLEHDHVRQAAMRQQLTTLGMDFRFCHAVNGAQLPQLPQQYNQNKRLRYYGFDMKLGEIGCFLSHRQCWEYAAQTEKTVLILEDDAQLSPDLRRVLDFALNAPQEWDMVRLCGARTKANIRYELARQGGYALVEELKDPALSTAYLLRPSGARKLLKASRQFYIPVDNFMECRHWSRVRTLSILPYPVTTMVLASTIGDRELRGKTLGFRLRRLLFRSYRDLVKALWIAGKFLNHAIHGRWPSH
ncbi:MAG: glycosyltransferase family 25 protein [Limnohabitans sp.]